MFGRQIVSEAYTQGVQTEYKIRTQCSDSKLHLTQVFGRHTASEPNTPYVRMVMENQNQI